MMAVLDELGETKTTSPEQYKILLSSARIIVLGAGEGSGKTWCASRWCCAKLHFDAATYGFHTVGGKEVAIADLYWFVGVTYKDAYKDWKECMDACERTGILDLDTVHTRDEGDQTCSFRTIYGQLVETVSGADPTNVAREQPYAVVGAEASRWDPELWDRCHGRIERRAKDGGRGFFSGSFETANGAFYDWFKRGQGGNPIGIESHTMPSWANLVIFPGGYDDPAIQRLIAANGKDRFMERFGGQPAPPRHAVLPEFSTIKHVSTDVYYTDEDDTYIFIDPGSLIYSVLFVQHKKDLGEIWVVDEIYAHRSTDLLMIAEAKSREGWKYASKTRRIVIDVAGYAQNTSGDSPAETWRKETGFWVSGKKYAVDNTVDRLRVALGENPLTGRARLLIHSQCKGIISEGGGTAPPYKDEGVGGLWVRFSNNGKPKRENDHSWKALGYGLQQLFGHTLPDAEAYTLSEYLGDGVDSGASYLDSPSWNLV